jgi:hypothetical protein
MSESISKVINESISNGEMDKIWRAICSELDCDLTVECIGGPVQIRFGDYICGSFKRVPLSKIVRELIEGIDGDENDYYLAIAEALIRQGKRIRSAVNKTRLTSDSAKRYK